VSDKDVDDEIEGDLDDLEDGLGRSKKLAGKKIVLFIALPVLLLAGVGGAVMMSGIFDSKDEKHVEVVAKEEAGQEEKKAAKSKTPVVVYFDLPELLVNLNSSSRRPSFLKLKLSLELESAEQIAHLETLQPRIIDNFQVYLRELRIEDLRGSAGIYRMREELLARVNASVHPTIVKNVLFKEVLVQ